MMVMSSSKRRAAPGGRRPRPTTRATGNTMRATSRAAGKSWHTHADTSRCNMSVQATDGSGHRSVRRRHGALNHQPGPTLSPARRTTRHASSPTSRGHRCPRTTGITTDQRVLDRRGAAASSGGPASFMGALRGPQVSGKVSAAFGCTCGSAPRARQVTSPLVIVG